MYLNTSLKVLKRLKFRKIYLYIKPLKTVSNASSEAYTTCETVPVEIKFVAHFVLGTRYNTLQFLSTFTVLSSV